MKEKGPLQSILRDLFFELAELSAQILVIGSILMVFMERLQSNLSLPMIIGGIILKIMIRRYRKNFER